MSQEESSVDSSSCDLCIPDIPIIKECTKIPLIEYNGILETYVKRTEELKSYNRKLNQRVNNMTTKLTSIKLDLKRSKRRLDKTNMLLKCYKEESGQFIVNSNKRLIDFLDENGFSTDGDNLTACNICYSLCYNTLLFTTKCCKSAKICVNCIKSLDELQIDFTTEGDGFTIRENIILEAKCPYCRAPYKNSPWDYFI